MKVTNGRIVHINDVIGKCQPLIVSDVVTPRSGAGQLVTGLVVRQSGTAGTAHLAPYSEAPYDKTVASQTWHWPEREE